MDIYKPVVIVSLLPLPPKTKHARLYMYRSSQPNHPIPSHRCSISADVSVGHQGTDQSAIKWKIVWSIFFEDAGDGRESYITSDGPLENLFCEEFGGCVWMGYFDLIKIKKGRITVLLFRGARQGWGLC